jgi:hypothetical protein
MGIETNPGNARAPDPLNEPGIRGDDMPSKESLLREADALRELARHTRRVMELASNDNQKTTLRRHADNFDKQASALESMAAEGPDGP